MVRRTLIYAICIFLAGCFETTVPLGSPDKASVDATLVGDWSFPAVDKEKAATLVVRNLDTHQYYAEWTEDDKPLRTVSFIVDIKGVPFAQVRPLSDDGTVAEKHWIMRLSIADGKLGIRQLKDDFFKLHPTETTERLLGVLEQNLDNPEMYDGDFRTAAKKEAKKN